MLLVLAQRWRLVFLGFLTLFAIWLFFSSFTTVPAGYVGVKTQFGRVAGTLEPGLHFLIPFGIQSVKGMDTRVLKADVQAEAGSKDLQVVQTDIVVNYHLDPKKVAQVYQDIGTNDPVVVNIIMPATSEVVKAAVAKKTAEEILQKRPELKNDIDNTLRERLASYNVIVDDVSIVNVSFSKQFDAAIEAKQVAEQQAKQAQFIADKAIKEAEALVNQARGQSEAQRLQQQSLTPELLQKMAIERWDGKFPTYMAGDALPFININR